MSTAGPNAPGTMADDSAVGTKTWSNVNNAKVSDNTYTTIASNSTAYGHYLKATNFGFSIPSGATINGVTVSIDRKGSASAAGLYCIDYVLKLVKGGTVSGNNKGDTVTKWPTTEATKSYGGAADLWGLSLADTDVNDSTFGVVLEPQIVNTFGKLPVTGYVDLITITIDYTAGGGGGGLSIPVAMHSYRQRRV